MTSTLLQRPVEGVAHALSASGTAATSIVERALTFPCEDEQLLGVLHLPAEPGTNKPAAVGVVVVVGGPQVRAGSHRQFVLLARALAAAGHPVLRFDVRGMGDSTGELRKFEQISPDIGAAIDALMAARPQLGGVVLWGLCDGASAALLYRQERQDVRVVGLCLLNPWVRSESSLARAHVKYYYVDRLRQWDFWRKLLSGKVALSAMRGLWQNLRTALAGAPAAAPASAGAADLSYQDRMALAWRSAPLPILLLLSGDDYTAKEFLEYAAMDRAWQGLPDLPHVMRQEIAGADHTLSNGDAQRVVEELTLRWVRGIGVGATAPATGR